MISLLSFWHACFMRSYRYGPPAFVFVLGIIFVYSVVPNPVMESYAFSASFLFVVSAAVCYAVIDIETPNQEAVTLIHAGSLVKLYVSKLLYGWLFTIPLAGYAVLFPAVFRKFDRPPGFEEIAMSLLYHCSSSWLAVSLACWFTAKFIRSRLLSFLSLSVLVAVTLGVRALESALPGPLKHAVFVLPPLDNTIALLSNYDAATLFAKMSALGAPFLYGILAGSLFLFVIRKRKLDFPQ